MKKNMRWFTTVTLGFGIVTVLFVCFFALFRHTYGDALRKQAETYLDEQGYMIEYNSLYLARFDNGTILVTAQFRSEDYWGTLSERAVAAIVDKALHNNITLPEGFEDSVTVELLKSHVLIS